MADSEDMEYFEERLKKEKDHYKNIIVNGIIQGVGMHHAGLNNRYRSSVEMLFRIGILKGVFATGTLALGANKSFPHYFCDYSEFFRYTYAV